MNDIVTRIHGQVLSERIKLRAAGAPESLLRDEPTALFMHPKTMHRLHRELSSMQAFQMFEARDDSDYFMGLRIYLLGQMPLDTFVLGRMINVDLIEANTQVNPDNESPLTRRSERTIRIAAEALRLYKTGATLEVIGRRYDVTRERIRQILLPHAAECRELRAARSVQKKQAAHQLRLDRRDPGVRKRRGMSAAEYDSVRRLETACGVQASPAFISQRNSAHTAGKEWNLTFAQWWQFWVDSGHWAQRGIGKGKYVLARIDRGSAFKIGNLRIMEHGESVALQRKEERAAGTGRFKRLEPAP